MMEELWFFKVCEMLGLPPKSSSGEEVVRTLEELQSLALTGEMPERWTLTEGGEGEAPM